MPINASILQNLRQPKFASPAEPLMTGLQLRNAMQENQSGQLSIQQKQLDLETQRRTQQAGEAIHQALIETGGDIEKALPKIAQISPELYPHYKKFVDDQKDAIAGREADARKTAVENYNLQNGKIDAPERPVGEPGVMAAPPSVAPENGVAPIQSSIAQGFNQELPVPNAQIPGANGQPGVSLPVLTAQQATRKARAEAAAKKQLEIDAKLDEPYTLNPGDRRMVRGKIIAEGAAKEPPKSSFEEMTYEDWLKDQASKAFPKNRVGFDRYKQQQAIERAQASKADEGGAVELTPAGLDAAARAFAKTGQLPPMGMGKPAAAARSKIINRAAVLSPDLDIAGNRAEYEANKKSLEQATKLKDALASFEGTALKNMAILESAAKRALDAGSPWINRPLRSVDEQLVGNVDLPVFRAARQIVVNEVAKLTNNPNLTGTLSDSARHEIESLMPPDMTLKQLTALLPTLRQDMKNRTGSIDEQVRAIQQRIKDGGGLGSGIDDEIMNAIRGSK